MAVKKNTMKDTKKKDTKKLKTSYLTLSKGSRYRRCGNKKN